MKTVELSAFDIQEALMIAERVHAIRSVAHSSKERVLTASPFEGDYMGAIGEIAVCRHFGIQHHRHVELGGDGGDDLNINGWRVQVKCTGFQGNNPSMIMKTKEMFSSQVAILTRIKSPTTVELVGCCTRERFMQKATQKVFVDSADWHIEASALADVDVITKHKAAA